MDVTETLRVTTREAWRAWLAANHETAPEIWLVSDRKHAGGAGLPYAAAVEEALCFGWIDSTRKSLDADRYAQRFTPRRAGSAYSQINLERLALLIEQGRVLPGVLGTLGDRRAADYEIPADIVAALRDEPGAMEFFRTTPHAYQRIRAAYVDAGRGRAGEFEKRLRHLVAMSARGMRFGYGIERFY